MLQCTYVLMVHHLHNKEHLHCTSSHYVGVAEDTMKVGVRAFVPVWYLKVSLGTQWKLAWEPLYLYGTKVSLGTQRLLCSVAQEQRSRRAIRRRDSIVRWRGFISTHDELMGVNPCLSLWTFSNTLCLFDTKETKLMRTAGCTHLLTTVVVLCLI